MKPSSPPLVTGDGRSDQFEALFLENLPLIKRICAHAARRYRLAPEDHEDFKAEVSLKLVSQNYKALRQFEGHCKLESYLFMLINRMFWEWRNKLKGRWRPSTEAKRQGALAIKLEELIYRDGRPMSEACRILTSHHGASAEQAESLLAVLPRRTRREIVSVEAMDDLASQAHDVEGALLDRERASKGRCLQTAINQALAQLPEEDQLILKLSFRENIKTVDIAKTMGYPAKKLYRRVEKLLLALRKELERAGYDRGNREEWFQSIKIAALTHMGTNGWGATNPAKGHNHDR